MLLPHANGFEKPFIAVSALLNAVMVVCTVRKRSRRRPDHGEPNIRGRPKYAGARPTNLAASQFGNAARCLSVGISGHGLVRKYQVNAKPAVAAIAAIVTVR